ncbi:TPA: hypothetical protein EYO57_20695 [Candidatus Poribacteria bacterium]|nr:hypothetical protein [Candidatus Poribacteria bacterium]
MSTTCFNRRKYLVLDSRIIKSAKNVTLRVGTAHKHPANPLFGEDRPWEVRYDNLYPNVLFDEEDKIFKCWYNPFIIDGATADTPVAQRASVAYGNVSNSGREMALCYATSSDGISWHKPDLGIIEYASSRRNNLLVRASHGPGVFKDLEESEAAKRYKMLFASDVPAARHGLSVRFSANGIHWAEAIAIDNKNAARGDAHHTCLWAPELKKYVACSRPMGWGERRSDQQDAPLRPISRTESEDFIHWSDAEIVLDPSELERQYYVMPICRYADVYLGMLMIFNAVSDRVHCELSWSPDTLAWYHVEPGTPLIDTSPQKGDYDWGCVYASVPVFMADEIRIYYGASDDVHYGWRQGYLALATLRPNGLAGLQPDRPNLPGLVMTQPIVCVGRQLFLSAEAQGGEVQVALLNAEGQILEQSNPIAGEVNQTEVTWVSGQDLSAYQQQAIQLRFQLNKAKLYAFDFYG